MSPAQAGMTKPYNGIYRLTRNHLCPGNSCRLYTPTVCDTLPRPVLVAQAGMSDKSFLGESCYSADCRKEENPERAVAKLLTQRHLLGISAESIRHCRENVKYGRSPKRPTLMEGWSEHDEDGIGQYGTPRPSRRARIK